jgi:hypothetical protein
MVRRGLVVVSHVIRPSADHNYLTARLRPALLLFAFEVILLVFIAIKPAMYRAANDASALWLRFSLASMRR